jgi:hypothetical protein
MRIYDATSFCLFGIRKGEKIFGGNLLSVSGNEKALAILKKLFICRTPGKPKLTGDQILISERNLEA